jgi:hypothetical protein
VQLRRVPGSPRPRVPAHRRVRRPIYRTSTGSAARRLESGAAVAGPDEPRAAGCVDVTLCRPSSTPTKNDALRIELHEGENPLSGG